MRRRPQVHLARIRRDLDSAQGWCYASLCQAVTRAGSLHGLTHDPDKVTCAQCRRWIPQSPWLAQDAAPDWENQAAVSSSKHWENGYWRSPTPPVRGDHSATLRSHAKQLLDQAEAIDAALEQSMAHGLVAVSLDGAILNAKNWRATTRKLLR